MRRHLDDNNNSDSGSLSMASKYFSPTDGDDKPVRISSLFSNYSHVHFYLEFRLFLFAPLKKIIFFLYLLVPFSFGDLVLSFLSFLGLGFLVLWFSWIAINCIHQTSVFVNIVVLGDFVDGLTPEKYIVSSYTWILCGKTIQFFFFIIFFLICASFQMNHVHAI